MASRKPKGIADDIVGGIRKIVSPWLGAPPAQNRSVTQAQGLARSAAETLDQAFAGGMVKAGVQGNKALVKQAAVNVAALGTGYIAGKAVQRAIPALQARMGKEIGVHLSNTDKLRNIKFSAERAGTGSGYPNVEMNQTYKYSPNIGLEVDDVTKKIIIPKYVNPPESSYDFSTNVAEFYVDVLPKKNYAYITQSRRGQVDPKMPIWSNAQMVPKQKVVQKVPLPNLSPITRYDNDIVSKSKTTQNFENVRKVLYDALLKREQITQSNLRSTINTVRGATGVATQQTGTKKIKRR